MSETGRVMCCPECGRVASIAPWVARPVCVHDWAGGVPEVWDGDDADSNGEGRLIEWSPNEKFRVPGPGTWAVMVEVARPRGRFARAVSWFIAPGKKP